MVYPRLRRPSPQVPQAAVSATPTDPTPTARRPRAWAGAPRAWACIRRAVSVWEERRRLGRGRSVAPLRAGGDGGRAGGVGARGFVDGTPRCWGPRVRSGEPARWRRRYCRWAPSRGARFRGATTRHSCRRGRQAGRSWAGLSLRSRAGSAQI